MRAAAVGQVVVTAMEWWAVVVRAAVVWVAAAMARVVADRAVVVVAVGMGLESGAEEAMGSAAAATARRQWR